MSRPSKRADIVAAGVEVLHRSGYAGTSVETITVAAGVPKGSFFNHFGTKRQFVGEALNAYFDEWVSRSNAILEDSDSLISKLDRLLATALGESQAGVRYDGCLIGNLSIEVAHQEEELRVLLSEIYSRWAQTFEALIAQGQAAGLFQTRVSAPMQARFIVNYLQGTLLRAKVDRNAIPIDDFRTIIRQTLVLAEPLAPTPVSGGGSEAQPS
jgi:TetR/AcrR family transcriptional repressor of nem operon